MTCCLTTMQPQISFIKPCVALRLEFKRSKSVDPAANSLNLVNFKLF